MHYMAPKMSPVQLMLIWHVLDEDSLGTIGILIMFFNLLSGFKFRFCFQIFSGALDEPRRANFAVCGQGYDCINLQNCLHFLYQPENNCMVTNKHKSGPRHSSTIILLSMVEISG